MKSRSAVCSGRFIRPVLFKAAALSVSMGLCGGFAGGAMAQASNDEAATARELDVLQNQNSSAYVEGALLQGATASSGLPSCADGSHADVWYYVPTFSQMTVNAYYSANPLTSGSISIYTGSGASSLTEMACTAFVPGGSEGQIQYTTAEGESAVWIRLAGADTAQSGNLYVWAYQSFVEGGTTSDSCDGAPYVDWSNDTTTGALLSGATASPGQPAGLSVPDIWFSVIARRVTVEYDDGATSGPGFAVIYWGGSGGLSSVGYTAARDADGKFRVTALLGVGEHGEGLSGVVRVGSASTSANQSVRVLTSCPNDLTAGPQAINLTAGQAGCETVSGRLLLNATSPGYAAWGDDYWASCADPDAVTVWYHVPVAPGQTVTATYSAGAGTVSLWSGDNQYEVVEQDCAAVTSASTPAPVSYTAGAGESGVWIQLSGDDTWASVELDVCLSQ